jgi:hypothetical protein
MGLWVRLGTNVMVLFMAVIYNVPNKGMFVSGERFHPSLFGGKVGACPRGAPFMGFAVG